MTNDFIRTHLKKFEMGSCFIHSGTHPSPKSPKKDSIGAPKGDSPILGLQPERFQNKNNI